MINNEQKEDRILIKSNFEIHSFSKCIHIYKSSEIEAYKKICDCVSSDLRDGVFSGGYLDDELSNLTFAELFLYEDDLEEIQFLNPKNKVTKNTKLSELIKLNLSVKVKAKIILKKRLLDQDINIYFYYIYKSTKDYKVSVETNVDDSELNLNEENFMNLWIDISIDNPKKAKLKLKEE